MSERGDQFQNERAAGLMGWRLKNLPNFVSAWVSADSSQIMHLYRDWNPCQNDAQADWFEQYCFNLGFDYEWAYAEKLSGVAGLMRKPSNAQRVCACCLAIEKVRGIDRFADTVRATKEQ